MAKLKIRFPGKIYIEQMTEQLSAELTDLLEEPPAVWICSWCGEEYTDAEPSYDPGNNGEEMICDDCAGAGGHIIF